MTLKIAIPKGRLGNDVISLLHESNIGKVVDTSSRKLIFSDPDHDLVFNLIKNSDVITYVENKVFDIGFTGKDMLMEQNPDVYALERLNIGICKLAIAAMKGKDISLKDGPLRVATKYGQIAKRYFAEKGMDIRLVPLNGSIELAPVLGLSDAIVDVVETGNTLKANGLEVIQDMYSISCYIIANKVSYKFKREKIEKIISYLPKEGFFCD